MIREQLEKFFLLDNEFIKLNNKFNEWDLWPIIRYNLSEIILSENGIAAIDNKVFLSKKNKGIKFYIFRFFRLLSSILSLRNLFSKSEILVINDQSNLLPNTGETGLVYSIRKSLLPKKNVCFIDIKSSTEVKNIKILKISEILSLLRFLFEKISSNYKLKQLLNIVFIKVKNHYNIDISWSSNVLIKNITHQILLAKIVKLLIIIKKPKLIIYSDDGSMRCVNKVARDYNIKTINYQHAILSSETINHNYFKDDPYKKYRSDYFLTWGDYRMDIYRQNYKCIDVGYPYFDDMYKRFRNKIKNNSSILIISDGSLTLKELSSLAIKLSNKFDNKKIYYKLRLEEYNNWKQNYSDKFINTKNITIIDSNKKPLYEYFSEAEYVIGTNSTALIEAIGFSKVIVYKAGFYFELENYITDNLLLFSEGIEETIRIIEDNSYRTSKIKLNNIFKNNSKQNIIKTVDHILSIDKNNV